MCFVTPWFSSVQMGNTIIIHVMHKLNVCVCVCVLQCMPFSGIMFIMIALLLQAKYHDSIVTIPQKNSMTVL